MRKTVKSYAKRLKVTRTGKVKSRKPGQNHFNAKERSRIGMNKHRLNDQVMNNDAKSRFLINLG
ncbi:MAG: bL35 family ribosomal protein [Minisyncoccia bacterium]|jgi:ribosomal protein L35